MGARGGGTKFCFGDIGLKFKSWTTQTITHYSGKPCPIWACHTSLWSREKALKVLFRQPLREISHGYTAYTRTGCLTASQTWPAPAGTSRACPGPLRQFYSKIWLSQVSLASLRSIEGKSLSFEPIPWMKWDPEVYFITWGLPVPAWLSGSWGLVGNRRKLFLCAYESPPQAWSSLKSILWLVLWFSMGRPANLGKIWASGLSGLALCHYPGWPH